MKIHSKIYYILLGVSTLLPPKAIANTYLKILTTPPPNYIPIEKQVYSPKNSPIILHNSQIQIISPNDSYHYAKYLAYQRSRNNNEYTINIKDTLQDTIYLLETLALGRFVYKLYNN